MRSKYKDSVLEFKQDSIFIVDYHKYDVSTPYVMMRWEDAIMKRHAEVVCENGGDILEIGFGMGMSAGYIQAQNPKSHTIVEIHPQIIEKLEEWAADKPNVNIVRGDWYEQLDNLGVYDGIFYDAFGDRNSKKLKESMSSIAREGTIFTFWNDKKEENTKGFTENISYERIETTLPPEDEWPGYFYLDAYYLPKVII